MLVCIKHGHSVQIVSSVKYIYCMCMYKQNTVDESTFQGP